VESHTAEKERRKTAWARPSPSGGAGGAANAEGVKTGRHGAKRNFGSHLGLTLCKSTLKRKRSRGAPNLNRLSRDRKRCRDFLSTGAHFRGGKRPAAQGLKRPAYINFTSCRRKKGRKEGMQQETYRRWKPQIRGKGHLDSVS